MLVLRRRVGERLLIGDNIEILFLSDHHGGFRIGITAPDDVQIVRAEIAHKFPPRKHEEALTETVGNSV
jgi:carbon storage regulator